MPDAKVVTRQLHEFFKKYWANKNKCQCFLTFYTYESLNLSDSCSDLMITDQVINLKLKVKFFSFVQFKLWKVISPLLQRVLRSDFFLCKYFFMIFRSVILY